MIDSIGGFVLGVISATLTAVILTIVVAANMDSESEILEVSYKNNNSEVSRQYIEDMVKSHFPSSKWEKAECKGSKNFVRIRFANP